jgi:hypothetical protein
MREQRKSEAIEVIRKRSKRKSNQSKRGAQVCGLQRLGMGTFKINFLFCTVASLESDQTWEDDGVLVWHLN